MDTVLISGGAGYIGSHAAKAFAKNGFKVIVIDNLVSGHRDFVKWGDFVHGDTGDADQLEKIFSAHNIDIVSHFAAHAYVGESVGNPAKYYLNNVSKAHVLATFAARYKVKVFQFSSSCAVYGEPEKTPITEDHPKKPINPYGNTKFFFEEILNDFSYAYGINFSILRYFNAAGASPDGEIGEDHNPETHLIPLILDSAIQRRPGGVEIFGDQYPTPDGTCIRDYIHVSDLAEAHVLAAKKTLSTKTNTVYNLGNGDGFSVKEVIKRAQAVTGLEIPFRTGNPRAGDPAILIGSSGKIIRELGWKPEFASLDKILESAWKWHVKRFARKK